VNVISQVIEITHLGFGNERWEVGSCPIWSKNSNPMKSFFDSLTIQPEEGLTVSREGEMIQMEIPCCDGSLFTYMFPRNEKSVWIAACWDRTFDFINRVDADEALNYVDARWPYMGELLRYGLNEEFEKGALRRIDDPEAGYKKWAVVTTVDGIGEINSAEQFWGFPQLLGAIEMVQKASGRLYEELSSNWPEGWTEEDKNVFNKCNLKNDALFFQFGLTEA